MSSLAPPPFDPNYGQRIRRQTAAVRKNLQQRRILDNNVFNEANRARSTYTLDLGRAAQSASRRYGYDAGDFITKPEWYQSMIEDPAPLPDIPGFVGRMGARIHDGTVMAQMGRVGSNVLYGVQDKESALEEIEKLRGSLTDFEWLQHQRGLGPWIERQLGTALEAGAMQADILFNEAGVGALAGLALASPSGPAGMALAGKAGATIGFAGGNVRVMQGLAYLDLLQHEIELQDGTKMPMPEEIARSAAKTIGAINGAIEFIQWRMAGPLGARMVQGVRRLTDRALRRMMVDGTFRSIAGRAALHGGVVGGAEVGQEVAQEIASAIGSHVALEVAESELGGVRVDGLPLGEAIAKAAKDTLAVGPGIALLALPGTIGAVRSGRRAQRAVGEQPETLFDRTEPHETTPMTELARTRPTPRQRMAAEETVRQAQRTGTLQPIPIERSPAGEPVVATPEAQAVVEVLRTHGAQQVPTTPAAGSPEQQQQAAAEAKPEQPGAPDERPVAADGIETVVRDPQAFDELRQYLREALPEGVSDEQIVAAAITAENFTDRANLTLREWMDRRFPAGVSPDPETAASLLAGTYRRQGPPPDMPVSEEPPAAIEPEPEAVTPPAAEDEGDRRPETTTAEPQEEVPLRYIQPRAQATALPPPVAQPVAAVVDPIRLEAPEIEDDPERPGTAIVAWEGPEGELQVVGGAARANLMRELASEGAPFEVPVQLLRSADGVTLEQAQALGPEIANAAGGSVVDVAESLRGLPIGRMLARVPLTDRRMRQALALARLEDDAFNAVQAGDVAPEHAAWIGILQPGDPDIQIRLAESFMHTPPASVFEAEVRVRKRWLFDTEINAARILALARAGTPGDLFTRAQRLGDRMMPLFNGMSREHLSRGELYGRALMWWTTPGTVANDYLLHLAESSMGIEAAAEKMQEVLRTDLENMDDRSQAIELAGFIQETRAPEPAETPPEPEVSQPEPAQAGVPEPETRGWRAPELMVRGRAAGIERAPSKRPGRRGRVTKWGVRVRSEDAVKLGPGDVLHVTTRGGKSWYTRFQERIALEPGGMYELISTDDSRMETAPEGSLPLTADEAEQRERGEAPPEPEPAAAPEPDAQAASADRFRELFFASEASEPEPAAPTLPKGWEPVVVPEGAVEVDVIQSPGVDWQQLFAQGIDAGDRVEVEVFKTWKKQRIKRRATGTVLRGERGPMVRYDEPVKVPGVGEPETVRRITPKYAAVVRKLPDEAVTTWEKHGQDATPDTGLPAEPEPSTEAPDTSVQGLMKRLAELEREERGDDPGVLFQLRAPDVLYQDRPSTIEAERQRIVFELLKRIMWDEGLHQFGPFADRFMEQWGSLPYADVMRGRLRDWYELARTAAPPWRDEMSGAQEVAAWYEEVPDVRGRGAERAEGEAAGAAEADDSRREPGPVPEEPGGERVREVPPPGQPGAVEPEREGEGEGGRDRRDRGGDRGRVTTNWSFGPGELAASEKRGPVAKAKANADAIETVKRIQSEQRESATPAEQRKLARYVGWGGLPQAFPDNKGRFGKGFEDVGKRIQDLLTDQEYAAARASIQYAHYTSEAVISSMWKIAQQLGYRGGPVLDPGSGVGHFGGMMPGDLAPKAGYLGVELDPITAQIAKLLYPGWSVRQDDFTDVNLPDNTFALAIGNPPFGNITVADDRKYARHKFLLHDYFFAKSIDAVRPGGLMAFVTSAGTMNKRDAKARTFLAERADFLGGIRLPNIAFKQSAGTEVTTDVLVFRKRKEGAAPQHVAPWTGTVEQEMEDRKGNPVVGRVNEYFVAHPEQVLGDAGMYDELTAGVRYAVRATKGINQDNLPEHIDQAANRLLRAAPARAPAVMTDEIMPETSVVEFLGELPESKEGAFHITDDGKLLQLRDGQMQPAMRKGSAGKYVKLNAKEEAQVRALVPIRDAYRDLLAADVAEDAVAGSDARARLTEVYDRFVAEFGPITSKTIRGTTERFTYLQPFLADPESYRLLSLELEYDPETNTAEKGPVFERSVVRPPPQREIRTAEDAMLHVVGATGTFDADAAAAVWGRSTPELIDALGELVFRDPKAATWMMAEEYLSGDVVTKLQDAQIAMSRDPAMERNVEALRAVQPKPIPQSRIAVRLGSPWIPTEHIDQFAYEVMLLNNPKVSYAEALGKWGVTSRDATYNRESNALFGVNKGTQLLVHSTQVLKAALNQQTLRAPRVWDGEKEVADPEGDRLAQEAVDKLQAAFAEWIWNRSDRRAELVDLYNDRYNREVPRQWRSDYITTPGISSDWEWLPHQKRAIARILYGNTYVNHAVGSGKTATMIAGAMEARRLGLAVRPLFVVPNHVISHFASEWYQLYPEAKILVADEWQFHGSRRKKFVAEAGTGDYDGIVMSFSSFGLVPMSNEHQQKMLAEAEADFRAALNSVDKDDRFTKKQIEAAIERLKRKLKALQDKKADDVLTFEELGIDMLFVDEAHEYRNLGYATTVNLKGINPTGNQKAQDLYGKTRYLEEVNPGHGVVFASGTPVTNSLAEIYTLQRYLDDKGLREYGLQNFDSWFGQFGAAVTEPEPDVTGAWKYQTRFAGIPNQYELYRLMVRFMDVVTPAQLRENVVVPEFAGGEREQVYIDATDAQENFRTELAARLYAIRQRLVEPEEDNLLKLTTEGRQAAMDMRLLPGHSEVVEHTKVEEMIDRVYGFWEQSHDQAFHHIVEGGYGDVAFRGPATQIVFSPFGYESGGDRLYLPDYMKERLTERGVPREQIAYIGDYKTLPAKRALFRDMNAGKVRILIGSEQGMGTGVNVQTRLLALHALGPLWHPAGDEQRVGRIMRQGNLNPQVHVLDYSTVGSYDTTMWTLMRRKARGIEQFYRGDPDMEFVTDLSEEGLYAQAAAMTTSDPRALQLVEMQRNLEIATREHGAARREKANAESAAISTRRRLLEQQEREQDLADDIEQRTETAGNRFTIEIEGETYTKRADARTELQRLEKLVNRTRRNLVNKRYVVEQWDPQEQDWIALQGARGQQEAEGLAAKAARRIEPEDEKRLGVFAGFELWLRSHPGVTGLVTLGRRAGERPAAVAYLAQPGNLLDKLESQLRQLDKRLQDTRDEIEGLKEAAQRLDAEAAKPLPSREDLDQLQRDVMALEQELSAEQQEAGQAQAGVPQEEDADILTQLRVGPGGEQAAQLTADLVDQYGTTEDPNEQSYVLWDGRMLRRQPSPGGPDPAVVMEQTDAVRHDGNRVHAEGPMSDEQIATILKNTNPDQQHHLLLTHHGETTASFITRHPLNADVLRSFFARSPSPDPQPSLVEDEAAQKTIARGVTMFDDAGAAVMAFAEDADFDTLMEELLHVFRRDLPKDMEDVIAPWAGAEKQQDGSWLWNRDADETFARGGIQFLREGDQAADPPDAVRAVFERVADWLRKLYTGIRLAMSPDVRRAYEDLLFGRGRPEVLAFERMQDAMSGRDSGEFTDGFERVRVQKMGEGWVVDRLNEEDDREARRQHPDLEAALQDVAGLPTVNVPVPIGNARFGAAPTDGVQVEPKNAALDFATDDMTLADLHVDMDAVPSGSETAVDPTMLEVDPQRFQYKGDVDEAAIRDRWRDTKTWSPLHANRLVVWQDRQGRLWVVDGHQRVALARMLREQGQPVPEITAIVYHEHDTSVAEVRRFAALKNMVEGTGTAVDAAKVLRELDPEAFDQAAAEMGVSNAVTEQARGLKNLSDEGLEIVARGLISPAHAAVIGSRTSDPVEQLALMRAFIEEQPANADVLFQRRDEREAGRREARTQDVRTAARAAQEPAPNIPATGLTGAEAQHQIRGYVRGARTRAEAEARRHAIDTLIQLGKLDQAETIPTKRTVRSTARTALQEAREEARQDEARRAARLDNLRHGRERIARIQRSLVGILRESQTLPEPLRTAIRRLAESLDINPDPRRMGRRLGRVTQERIDPAREAGATDPLRLIAVLDAILEGEVPPGTEIETPDVALVDMHLVDLERLHRRVQAAVHHVRKLQRQGLKKRSEDNRQAVADVSGELDAAPVALSTKLPGVLSSAVEVLGISSERPEFLLDRVGGKASRLYDLLWRRIKDGTQTQRTTAQDVNRQWSEDLRRVGVTDTALDFEGWLNEWIAAPDSAKHVRERWTRAELMSFALLWNDPYARRMMQDPAGGMVVKENPLATHSRETDAHAITEGMAQDLMALLGDQERRIIHGQDSPVRRLFDRLFVELNTVFRSIHGYDLEKWPSYMPVHIAQGAIPAGDVEQMGSALGYFQHQGGDAGTAPYQGFLQFRTGATKPISLRPFNTEVNAAIRHGAAYVGLEAPLRTARALITSPRVRQGLRRQGSTAPQYMTRYLQGVAGRSMGDDGLGDAVNKIRQNVTVATLASPTVALNQSLSLALAAIHVPAKYVAKAIGQHMSPREFAASRRRHASMDPDFALRIERGFDPDAAMRGEVGRQALPPSRRRFTRIHQQMMDVSMWALSAVDQWTVTNVEQAAVLYAMDAMAGNAKMSTDLQELLQIENPAAVPADKRLQMAYRYAQWVVQRTQPSHLPENLSDLQRRPVMRMFTSFSGYTNVAMNELRAGLRRLRVEGLTPEAARYAGMAIVSIAVLGPLGTAMLHRLRDALYDREPDPLHQQWISGISAMVYFVRDLQYLINRGWQGGFEPVVVEAMVDVVREGDRAVRAIARGEDVGRAMTRVVGAGSRLAGVPFWTLKNYATGVTGFFDEED